MCVEADAFAVWFGFLMPLVGLMEIKQQTLGIWSSLMIFNQACMVGARSKFAWKLSVFLADSSKFQKRKLQIKGETLQEREREKSKHKNNSTLPLLNVNNSEKMRCHIYKNVKLDEHSLNALNHVDFMRTSYSHCIKSDDHFHFHLYQQMCFPLENSLTWKYFYYMSNVLEDTRTVE